MTRRARLPGFGLTFGVTSLYLAILLLVPLAALIARAAGSSGSELWRAAFSARALAAYRVSLCASLAAAAINAVFGLLLGWTLARYRFFGRGLIDAVIDLPFALPTAVAGLTLTTLYARHGLYGRPLWALGVPVAFAPAGVVVALAFVSLPFVVRTVQPAIESLDPEVEEAAASLGAGPCQVFARVTLPSLAPALLSGFALAFARALGEYGSIVFISGNIPLRTEIVPQLIVTRLEQFDYPGAIALALVMLLLSLSLLFTANLLQRWSVRRLGGEGP